MREMVASTWFEHPDRARPVGDRARPVADWDRGGHVVVRRIDPGDGPVLAVDDPDRPATDGYPAGIRPDDDSVDDAPLLWIDAQERCVHGVGHPDCIGSGRDAGGSPRDRDLRRNMPVALDETNGVRGDRAVSRTIAGEKDRQQTSDQRRDCDRTDDEPPTARLCLRRRSRRRYRRQRLVRDDLVDLDPLRDSLEPLGLAGPVLQAVDLAGEMRDTFAREHLARRCDRAQTRRKVERAAAIPAARQRHRLAGVQPDADPERQLDATATLHLDRCAQSLPSGGEDDQRLVPAQLDQIAVVLDDNTADDVGER